MLYYSFGLKMGKELFKASNPVIYGSIRKPLINHSQNNIF